MSTQPLASDAALAFDGGGRQPHRGRGLLDRQATEVAELDNPCRAGIEIGEPGERVVEGNEAGGRGNGNGQGRILPAESASGGNGSGGSGLDISQIILDNCEEDKPLLIQENSQVPGLPEAIRSLMLVPLNIRKKVFGVLAVSVLALRTAGYRMETMPQGVDKPLSDYE